MFAGAGTIIQTGFVVEDIDAAIVRWIAKGAGPFMIFRNADVRINYRGEPANLQASVALGQLGGVQVELIQQHCDRPSGFKESFPDGWSKDGFQHLGFEVADFDDSLRKAQDEGFAPVMEGTFLNWRFCYLDTRAQFGFMCELIEATPLMKDEFGKIAAWSHDWDGSDPIRSAG